MFAIVLASVPTMLTVLIGILINNHRLNDMNARLGEMNAGLNGRFSDMNTAWVGRFSDMNAAWVGRFSEMNAGFADRIKDMNAGLAWIFAGISR